MEYEPENEIMRAEGEIVAGTPIDLGPAFPPAVAHDAKDVEVGSKVLPAPVATTIEQDIKALIARIDAANEVVPCTENKAMLSHLGQCLNLQRGRIASRKARGVLGTNRP